MSRQDWKGIQRRGGLASLVRDRRGTTATVFALAVVPALLLVAAGVDYANAIRIRARLQSAADTGVIAGATDSAQNAATYAEKKKKFSSCSAKGAENSDDKCKGVTDPDEDTKKIVKNAVVSAFTAKAGLTPTVSTTIDSAGTITTYASVNINVNFDRIIGRSKVPIGVTSQAMRGSGQSVEVALALDTTGSMAGAKIDGLRTAAKDLATTLFSVPDASSRIKMSVVPFAHYVNIGVSNKGASWLDGSEDAHQVYDHCEDTYPNARYYDPYTVPGTCYSEGAPYDCSWTAYRRVDYGKAVRVCTHYDYWERWYGCVGSQTYPRDTAENVSAANKVPAFRETWCSSALTRLTNSLATVTSAIDAMEIGGETYVPAGVLWGWRTLTDRLPFKDGAAAGASVQKVLVLMTDGANTLYPEYPYHWQSTDPTIANTRTAETCAAAKAEGIAIYAVAFSVTDPTIKGVLEACASKPVNYYDAATVSDLKAAFAKIGASITAIRLSK